MAGRLIVVQGAELRCSACPGGKSYLAPTISDDKIEGKRPATIKDHLPGLHVLPFNNKCQILNGPCAPNTPAPWQDNIFSGLFLAPTISQDLSPDDILHCTVGGNISIFDSCQSTVFVGSAPVSEDPLETSESAAMPLVGAAGGVALIDGPLPFGDAIGGGLLIVAGGIVLADAVSGDDDSDYEERYGDYEYEDSRENKRGPLKGGSRSSRDRDFGIKDADFWKWWERNKGSHGDIESSDEAAERFDEWVRAGKPRR